MPISSFMGLETALSGLEANQQAIQTTSNNIANASTPGYTQESVVLQESTSLTLPGGYGNTQLGTGVTVATITRASNQYLNNAYRAQNTAASYASTQSSTLDQVQSQLGEPAGTGISSQLSAFWTAWSSLADNPSGPTSPAARQTVINDGTALSEGLSSLSQQLSAVQSQAAQQYSDLTATGGELQSYANQIATLNGQIAQATQGGANANALLDQRDQVISNLSSLATVSVTTFANGMDSVSIGGSATALVSATSVSWPPALTAASGGELGALISLSGPGGQIASYLTGLDSIAGALVSSVNGLMSPSTPFFNPSGTTATTIGVSATASTIQTSTTGSPGANDVALAVAALSGGPADQTYATFVAQIGNDAQSAQNSQQTSQALLTSISNRVQSVSGVSLDQEMTNLLMYQQGYEASARVMTTMQSMLDTLINQVGAGL
jgi:flagellar hook-associated protein 1